MKSKSWRSLWHLGGGSFFPVLALLITRQGLLIILTAITFIFVTWEVLRFASPRVNQWTMAHLGAILRAEERSRLTGTTYLLLSSLIVFLLFERYIAITSLLFLSIGDLLAAIIGERFGQRRVFNKSLEGSLACLVSCLLVGTLVSWLSPAMTLPVAVAGAISATVVELLPLPVNDNLSIPLSSAAIMTVVVYFGRI